MRREEGHRGWAPWSLHSNVIHNTGDRNHYPEARTHWHAICSQVPGYLAAQDKLKEKGIDEIIVLCINDGAVMDAWAKDQGVGLDGEGVGALGDVRDHQLKQINVLQKG